MLILIIMFLSSIKFLSECIIFNIVYTIEQHESLSARSCVTQSIVDQGLQQCAIFTNTQVLTVNFLSQLAFYLAC